ncbi:MAG: hypothetical protein SOY64_02860 [Pyramidobacter sp.]|nr:hypothetical protein [Pyramidobacter sp.]
MTDKEKIIELSKTNPNTHPATNPPAVIVSVYRKDCYLPDYAETDMSVAMENLWLETDPQGLGGVWLGIAPWEDRMKAPTLPSLAAGNAKFEETNHGK